MYELKKWKGIYEYICWDRALVLWKKNLPGRGPTKVEKHCSNPVFLFLYPVLTRNVTIPSLK